MAQSFAKQFKIQFPLYTDPSRSTYKALGFPRGFGIGFSTISAGFSAASKGFVQGPVGGDVFQQGGEILFDSQGVVLWKHIATKAGQHTEEIDLLERISSAMEETE